uniref:Uncharacterized protein n=1 Tax=Phlebotomus papatasi TaxID=29031 RepID=A0A1B0CZX9_PHLPP
MDNNSSWKFNGKRIWNSYNNSFEDRRMTFEDLFNFFRDNAM